MKQKSYFELERLKRNLHNLKNVCRQIDLIANDLKNEPMLRAICFECLNNNTDSHLHLFKKLLELIEAIESGKIEAGDQEPPFNPGTCE